MAVKAVSASELQALVAAELHERMGGQDVDAEAVLIVPRDTGWWAALRRDGGLIDEARHAAVAEACHRLADGFALDPAAG
ncbi:MAG TPA: hypothetical protein VHA70_07935 [Bauldia sp.]|nr:hypothetical protein [Bauldia sp.]